jgi:NTP pyrophosphatase (non-canonical NTP hydrolase)
VPGAPDCVPFSLSPLSGSRVEPTVAAVVRASVTYFRRATLSPGMDEQRAVAAFVDDHDLETPPAFRLLDLVSELGEVAKDAVESTDYGANPDDVAVSSDEIGDAVFALLALAEALDVDAGDALAESMEKYERRLADGETPSSGDAG